MQKFKVLSKLRHLEQKPKLKFILDVLWVFLTASISLGVGAIVNIVIGNYLGAESLGLYVTTFTIFSLFCTFSSLGIESATTKFVAEHKNDKLLYDCVVQNSLILSSILGLISFLILFFSSNLIASFFKIPELAYLIKIISFSIPFYLVNDTFLGIINGLRKMNIYSYVNIVRRTSYLIFVLLTISFFGVTGAVTSQVFASVVTLFFIFANFKNIISYSLNFSNFKKYASGLVSFGSKIVISNSIGDLSTRMDLLMLAYFLSETEVGIYAVALLAFKFIDLVPAVLIRVTYPATTEYYYAGQFLSLEKMVNKVLGLSFIVLGLFSLISIFLYNDLILLFFPKQSSFLASYYPFVILALGKAFFGMTASIGSSFSAVGRPDIPLKMSTVRLFLNFILNYYLIQMWGINGAAFATTLSLALLMPIFLYYIKKLLHIPIYFNHYLKIFAILLFSLGITFILSKVTIVYLSTSIGCLLYLCLLLMYNIFSISDVSNLFMKIKN